MKRKVSLLLIVVGMAVLLLGRVVALPYGTAHAISSVVVLDKVNRHKLGERGGEKASLPAEELNASHKGACESCEGFNLYAYVSESLREILYSDQPSYVLLALQAYETDLPLPLAIPI